MLVSPSSKSKMVSEPLPSFISVEAVTSVPTKVAVMPLSVASPFPAVNSKPLIAPILSFSSAKDISSALSFTSFSPYVAASASVTLFPNGTTISEVANASFSGITA